MIAVSDIARRLTEAEYLASERHAEIKREFIAGEVFAMAGGTPAHSLIATNLLGELRNRLRGQPCVPYNSDLRLKVQASGLYTYPDVLIICGPLQFTDEQKDTIVNPTVIAEVLSDSTEAYDRGKKFEHYRRIPTLREYLLVSQKEPQIEQFVRADSGQWLLGEEQGLEASLRLASLGIVLPLAAIFARVAFRPSLFRLTTPIEAVRPPP